MSGAIAALLAGHPLRAAAFYQARATPSPMPSPNAPANQNVPAGLDGADIPVRNGGRPLPPVTWMEIKSDAQKMFDLANDFKWQVNRANLANTLPLLLLQEAHRMEKLAKQIQERMKR
ncbi:MAG TPA: hypothetical protein VFW25_11830 [Silvibacterium sp.]|nr:hypothetical protein [Silvibacterium sp.]